VIAFKDIDVLIDPLYSEAPTFCPILMEGELKKPKDIFLILK
jgi:hypothetical protein